MRACPFGTTISRCTAASLTLDTRKMTEAREQGLPVVLCSDFLQARIGSSVRAWRYAT